MAKDILMLASELANLTTDELVELKTVLKEKHGMVEPAPIIIREAADEYVKKDVKSSFKIVLTKVSEISSEKLGAVKIINNFTKLGLQASMALTKELPSTIADNVPTIEAEAFKNEVAALNCVVELT